MDDSGKNGIEILRVICYNTTNNRKIAILIQYIIILHFEQDVNSYFVKPVEFFGKFTNPRHIQRVCLGFFMFQDVKKRDAHSISLM